MNSHDLRKTALAKNNQWPQNFSQHHKKSQQLGNGFWTLCTISATVTKSARTMPCSQMNSMMCLKQQWLCNILQNLWQKSDDISTIVKHFQHFHDKTDNLWIIWQQPCNAGLNLSAAFGPKLSNSTSVFECSKMNSENLAGILQWQHDGFAMTIDCGMPARQFWDFQHLLFVGASKSKTLEKVGAKAQFLHSNRF